MADIMETANISLSPVDAASTASAGRSILLLPSISLCWREIIRFLRQPSRVIGALATPVVFWLVVGAGMNRSFNADQMAGGGTYLSYFFPGTILMILLFTAIFSTISIIEDRREGFLQGVLVSPVPRLAIVLGKVLGATVLAVVQAGVFLLLAPLVGVSMHLLPMLGALAMLILIGYSLAALGFCIAWRMTSTQGFHAIMNLLLLPMWMLSGALFPATGASLPIKCIMLANPLTYGLDALRQVMYIGTASAGHVAPLWVDLCVSVAFAIVITGCSLKLASCTSAADWQ